MNGQENICSHTLRNGTVGAASRKEESLSTSDITNLPSDVTREILARLPLNMQNLRAMAQVSKGWDSIVQDTFAEMWQQIQRCQDQGADTSNGGGVSLIVRPNWLYGDEDSQPARQIRRVVSVEV